MNFEYERQARDFPNTIRREELYPICEQCGETIEIHQEQDECSNCGVPLHSECLEIHCMECES